MVEKIKKFIKDHKLEIAFTIFVLAFSFFLMVFVRRDSDYFWHIKAGEYMFQHGPLTKDVFSWFTSGKYWMSHEWLFEIILYGMKCISPGYHILIYAFIFVTTLLMILFFANKEEYLKNVPFGMLWTAASMFLILFLQGRPQLMSFNLLALTIWFLYDAYRNENSKKIYFLPIISLLWANVHGGSSNLSYLFCFVFLIGGLFQFKFSKIEAKRISKKQIIKYLVVSILCMISININLHGFKMFLYPYENMLDTTMLNNIREWAPTNLNETSHYLYLGLVVFLLFVFLFSKKKIEFMDFLLFGVCVFLGFKSIRFWGYTFIIMSFVVFHYLEKRKLDKGTISSLLIASVLLFGLFLFNFPTIEKQLQWKYLTKEDIEAVLKEKPARLYNMYDYGGELVYAGIPVFIDGRADLYSKYNYKDYLSLSHLEGDYVSTIQKYDFDYFLVDQEYPIATYLKYNSEYEKIYKNKSVILYKKKNQS